MTDRTRQIGGAKVPTLIYGTAWKEERTADLVAQALKLGFRGLDTANQRRHYSEAEVGRALLAELERGSLRREDVFVQTKFTFRMGQDHRVPYDPTASVAQQVEQSFESSVLRGRLLQDIAHRHGRAPAQVILRFALQLEMIVLTGTTSPQHMADDQAVHEFELTSGDERNRARWNLGGDHPPVTALPRRACRPAPAPCWPYCRSG